ncbi:MAG: hypothetical protein J6U53_03615 [Tidjanibacter sp.]|nr:hypothetical protein [Tidjanibacter sp.]
MNKNISRYVGRALRHLLKLVVMVGVLVGVMYLTDTLAVSPSEMLSSYKGGILIAFMVAISLAFPFYGFSSVRVQVSMKEQRALILQAIEMSGYRLVCEREDGTQIYRTKSLVKHITSVGDDVLTLRPVGDDATEVSGMRKSVEALRWRIVGLLNNTTR